MHVESQKGTSVVKALVLEAAVVCNGIHTCEEKARAQGGIKHTVQVKITGTASITCGLVRN